jgi:hypothetical protein
VRPFGAAGVITAALAFIHERKWLVELILLAVLVIGVVLFCQHLIGVGVQRQKDDDARELVKLQHDADIKTAKAQERADIAEKARAIEITQLDDYRRLHPLHGRLCINEGGGHLPSTGAAHAGNDGSGTAAGDLLPLHSGNSGGDEGEPDQLAMLDALEAVADGVSAGLREYQARGQ